MVSHLGAGLQSSHLQVPPSLQQAQASLPSLAHEQAATGLLQHLHIAGLQASHLQAAPSLQQAQASLPSLAHVQAAPLSQQAQVALSLLGANGHQLGHELQPDIKNAKAIPSTHTITNFFIIFLLFYFVLYTPTWQSIFKIPYKK